MKKLCVLTALAICFLAASISLAGKTIPKSKDTIQRGLAVEKDGWVYYYDFGLYKASKDGSTRIKISNVKCVDFSIWGDSIYYSDFKGIYQMQIDGRKRKRIISCDCAGYQLTKDYIVYLENVDIKGKKSGGYPWIDKLWVYSFETGKSSMLIDGDIEDYYSDGRFIYFSLKNDGRLRRIDFDGSDIKLLSENKSSHIVGLNEEWIYLTDFRVLTRMKPDGSNKQVVHTSDVWGLQFMGETIYILNGSEGIFTCRADDFSNIRCIIKKKYIKKYSVVGDWIYFMEVRWVKQSLGGINILYRMKLDGSNFKMLTKIDEKIKKRICWDD